MSTSSEKSGAPAESLARAVVRQLTPLPAAAPFLADLPVLEALRAAAPRRLPVCGWLTVLAKLAAPATSGLVQEFVAAADALEWRQTYTAADFGREFLDRYGWTELIGLRGPIPSERIACGFLLLGPATEYPSHAHEAEELYLPLAGEALWMRGEESFVARAPGALVEHRSWTTHAMRTRRDPMLAVYLWRGGDLAAKSKIIRRG
jgi:hypothetical protein